MTDVRERADDHALIDAALKGDEAALGRLLAQDQGWAYNVAYRVLGREPEARDAVQDAFLLTVRAIRGDGSPPRSADAFRPWLRRVVSNAALSQVRRPSFATTVSVDTVAAALPAPAHAEPGQSIDREETRAQVLQALLSLPATQRIALALREVLDASYDDIAEALDLPRTAIGTLLFRARAGFRDAYDRGADTDAPGSCQNLVPLFSSLVDDEPRPQAWSELEAHLDGCDRCQGELQYQRRARRLYALMPFLVLPAGWDPVAAAFAGLSSGAASGGPTGTAARAPDAPLSTSEGGLVGASGHVGAGVPPPIVDPAAGATAATSAVEAATSLTAAPMAGTAAGASAGTVSGTAATAATGSAVVAPTGGLVAGLSAAKLAIGAVATAAVIGAAAVVGPLAVSGPEAPESLSASPIAASPVTSPLVAASPMPSPSVGVPVTPSGGANVPSPAVTVQQPVTVPSPPTVTAQPSVTPTLATVPAAASTPPAGSPAPAVP